MPNKADHIQLALHDMQVAGHLLKTPDYCDWTATTAFYAAVHIVEAILFPKHSEDHVAREEALKDHRYQKMWEHFRPLKNTSEVARYLEDRPGHTRLFESYMSPDQVQNTVIRHHLNQIVKSAGKLLNNAELSAKLSEEFVRQFQS